MTKKDYIAIAAIIKRNYGFASGFDERKLVEDIAEDIATCFYADNRRFDVQRFYVACGMADIPACMAEENVRKESREL